MVNSYESTKAQIRNTLTYVLIQYLSISIVNNKFENKNHLFMTEPQFINLLCLQVITGKK